MNSVLIFIILERAAGLQNSFFPPVGPNSKIGLDKNQGTDDSSPAPWYVVPLSLPKETEQDVDSSTASESPASSSKSYWPPSPNDAKPVGLAAVKPVFPQSSPPIPGTETAANPTPSWPLPDGSAPLAVSSSKSYWSPVQARHVKVTPVAPVAAVTPSTAAPSAPAAPAAAIWTPPASTSGLGKSYWPPAQAVQPAA